MRMHDALDHLTTQLQADGRSSHTIRQYGRHVRSLHRWLGEQRRPDEIAAITHEVVAAFLVSPGAGNRPDGKPKKSTSTNALRSSLRNFFGYLHRAGWIANDPTRLVRLARCDSPPPRALSDDDQRRLLAALDGAASDEDRRDRAFFRLMLATGIRLSSAIGIQVKDVDLDSAQADLRFVKGSRGGRIYLTAELVSILRDHIGDRADGPLFVGRAGKPLSGRHVQRRLAGWLHRAGVARPASPHSLRHSFAVALYQRTHDLLLVRDALQHASIASTTVYARNDEARLRHAYSA